MGGSPSVLQRHIDETLPAVSSMLMLLSGGFFRREAASVLGRSFGRLPRFIDRVAVFFLLILVVEHMPTPQPLQQLFLLHHDRILVGKSGVLGVFALLSITLGIRQLTQDRWLRGTAWAVAIGYIAAVVTFASWFVIRGEPVEMPAGLRIAFAVDKVLLTLVCWWIASRYLGARGKQLDHVPPEKWRGAAPVLCIIALISIAVSSLAALSVHWKAKGSTQHYTFSEVTLTAQLLSFADRRNGVLTDHTTEWDRAVYVSTWIYENPGDTSKVSEVFRFRSSGRVSVVGQQGSEAIYLDPETSPGAKVAGPVALRGTPLVFLLAFTNGFQLSPPEPPDRMQERWESDGGIHLVGSTRHLSVLYDLRAVLDSVAVSPTLSLTRKGLTKDLPSTYDKGVLRAEVYDLQEHDEVHVNWEWAPEKRAMANRGASGALVRP